MRTKIAIALLLSSFATSASAEQLNRFDRKVILRSVQCEMGRAAAASEVSGAVKGRAVMGVGTIEISEFAGREVGGVAKIFSFFSGEAKMVDELTTGYTVPFHYNLHVANMQACDDKNIASMGIQNCVVTNSDRFDEYWTIGQPFTCRQEGNGTKFVKAGVGGEYWVVNGSVYGAYTQKLGYKLAMTIPGAGKEPSVALPDNLSPAVPSVSLRTAKAVVRENARAVAWTSSAYRLHPAYTQPEWHRQSPSAHAAIPARHLEFAMWR